nr:AAA family ATPase [Candidatus Woesearchaeota archaeon]
SPPGEFKSIISVQMAINVAQGNTWMNFETQKNAVLYCDKENNDQIIKERLLGLIKGEEGSLEIPLFFLRREGDLLDKIFFKKLQNTISKNNIKLVFFDTLHRFADYDENRSDDINRFYTEVLQPLIEKYGVSIIFLHHTTKEGKYRGSGDFLGMVDTAYSVKRKKKGKKKSNIFEIINEKSRSGEIENILGDIEFILDDSENLDIIRINRLDEVKQEKEVKTKFKELVQKIEIIIKPDELLQRKDFEERLEYEKFEYSLGTLKNVLSWMSRNDILIKDKRHRYKLPIEIRKEKGKFEVIDVT